MASEVMNQRMEYMVAGEKVELTPNVVRQYLVSGNPENVTMQELVMFMNLCKYNGLNPWLKEAYCIKYGNQPATMVVGKEAYLKRAEINQNFDGMESGVIVLCNNNNEQTVENRIGTFHLPVEEVVGGWARVWRKDRSHPVTVEVSFDEYAGRTKDGSLNSQWRTKPATMIRKVALVQALREAFPGDIGGMYTEEETEGEPIINQASAEIKDNLPPVQETKKAAKAKAAPKQEPKPVDLEIVDAEEVEEMPFA